MRSQRWNHQVRYPVLGFLLLLTTPIQAQHHGDHPKEHSAHESREMSHEMDADKPADGSGTSWLPANTPMNAIHGKWNDWNLMFHTQIFLQYIETTGKRGDQQGGSINWFMGMMEKETDAGKIGLRFMLSIEPWTVGKCGFPDLLQTGEECNGEKLHDKQHPHDLFMELAGYWDKPLTKDIGLKLYAGPAAEPALGPTAFPHRPSSFPTPIAPISHHWLDASHISFGVVTAGLHSTNAMIEASAFNGREPDDNRSNFDLDPLDSYSGRFSWMPTKDVVFQVSGAYLHEGEEPEEGQDHPHDLKRYTTSIAIHEKMEESWFFSTLAYGLNQHEKSDSSAILAEASLSTPRHMTWGARAEWVQKTGEDLVIEDPNLANRKFDTGKLSFSLLQEFAGNHDWLPGVGASIDVSTYPSDLEPYYGDRPQVGYVVFASLRPKAMH